MRQNRGRNVNWLSALFLIYWLFEISSRGSVNIAALECLCKQGWNKPYCDSYSNAYNKIVWIVSWAFIIWNESRREECCGPLLRQVERDAERDSHAHHSSPREANASGKRRVLTFSSFPHQSCFFSSLPPSLFLQGPVNDRKWGRRLVKEGKQSKGAFMLNGGRKWKVSCHTHAPGQTEFTVHAPPLWGAALIQGLFNKIRAWN